MIVITAKITIDETKLSTNNYSADQIVEQLKNEILSFGNYEEPDTMTVKIDSVLTVGPQ